MIKILSKLPLARDKLNTITTTTITSLFTPRLGTPISNMVEQDDQHRLNDLSSSKVQALYELCKATFTRPELGPPSSHDVQKVCSLLEKIGPADVRLEGENPDDDRGHGVLGLPRISRIARWAQPITYIDICENDRFTMCIFCFPTSSVIPLHDHPAMTVFSKVLYGSLHVKSYDWVEPPCIEESRDAGHPTVRLAKLAVDKVLTASSGTSVLYPRSGGNLHCFTAVTPCAVLDILTPPYQESAGRKCTYYHDFPYSSSTGNAADMVDNKLEEYAWLAAINTPNDLYMRQGVYQGPVIHD